MTRPQPMIYPMSLSRSAGRARALLALCALCALYTLCAALMGCERAAESAEATSSPVEEAHAHAEGEAHEAWRGRVRWVAAQAAPRAALVTLPAEVVLPVHAQVDASPPLPGQLIRWLVTPGQRVEVGQPLAELRSPALAELRADEALYRDLVERHRKLLEEQRAFVRDGVQTRQSLYDAEAAYGDARAQLAATQQRLRAAQTLVTFSADGVHWTWTAGASGEVAAITCALGSVVDGHTACVTLIDAASSLLRVNLPERHLSLIGPDLLAAWSPSPWAEGATPLPMLLARQEVALDPASRTAALYYAPRDPADAAALAVMRPGVTGRVTLTTATATASAVRVPRLSVTRIDGTPHVFLGVDHPEPHPVTLIGYIDADAIITSDDLSPGTQVAAEGVFLLKSLHLLEESAGQPSEPHAH
jgi:cobalt-zinc-cadmium efflux system membrane fusion protein